MCVSGLASEWGEFTSQFCRMCWQRGQQLALGSCGGWRLCQGSPTKVRWEPGFLRVPCTRPGVPTPHLCLESSFLLEGCPFVGDLLILIITIFVILFLVLLKKKSLYWIFFKL